ncbi:RecQ family ATP-dependent DNA helicase [Marinithermus hydrothermalis]|uniref:ATP-dependent DNA helicase RecQ n=1 Tax=Marinithermus hydrothermalis (strain DSM 14884 / JCM 11576 / T1) TaxID=869210 RepID=F2NN93_MARHT|nr:RecQ family ATP-dependent DNA helicase [Marinithermus hydrothermalis]AEB10934.1 ATP-dependent DNA helicase, RecQ family [Marinithermus hydrothermalis DSM 14884]
MKPYVFIDLEATGTDPNQAQILQIVAYKEGAAPFEAFVDTPEPVSDTDEIWGFVGFSREKYDRHKRPLEEVLKELLEYVGDQPLAGHNILFYDIPLLERWLRACGLALPPTPALDTLRLAHLIFPTPPDERLRGYGLGDLYAYFFGRPLVGAHDALLDVAANREVARELYRVGKQRVPPPVLALWAHLGLEEARFLGADPPEDPALSLQEVLKTKPGIPWVYNEHTEGTRGFPRVWEDPEAHLSLLGSVRPPQIEMMRAVHAAFQEGRPVIVQAPTGTGKTRGYLFPTLYQYASRAGGDDILPTVIATHTKVLQDQAIRELERIRDAGYRVSAVNIKSARDYLCLEALKELVEEHPFVDEAERAATGLLLHYAFRGGYDLEALPFYWHGSSGYRAALFKARTHPERCVRGRHQNCAYYIELERRKRANVWVTNQAWLLAHFGGNPEGDAEASNEDAEEPQKAFYLVIDEAHNLEHQATEAFTRRVSGEALLLHLQRLYNPQRRTGLFRDDARPLRILGQEAEDAKQIKESFSKIRNQLVPEALEALEAYSASIVHFVKQHGHGNPQYQLTLEYSPRLQQKKEWPELRRDEERLVARLKALTHTLRQAVPKNSRLWFRVKPTLEYFKAFCDLARERAGLFKDGMDPSVENFVYEARVNHEGLWEQVAQPVDISVALGRLWERAKGIVLTSATLDLGDEFRYVKRVLGLENAKTLKLESTLPYHKAHLIIPTHLPEARGSMMRRFSGMLHEELKHLLPAAHRSLTLFTSKQRLHEAKKALEEQVPHLRAPLRRTEREEALQFMADGARPGHMLGSRSFMEGVDFPNLKLVNLERIPFPVPSLLLSRRGDLAESQGLDPWADVYLPQAMLGFVQAFGRLIRDDRQDAGEGAFVLWDKRIINALYQTRFFNALPDGVHQHVPVSRDAFYDLLAPVLEVERARLPQGELLDEDLKALRRIQEGPGTPLEKALEVVRTFWKNLDLTRDARGRTQLEGIEAALKGRHLFVFLPTGYGKSLIFQVPALVQGGLTVVISPLKALMYDQVEKLRDRGVPAARVDSSMPAAERKAVYDEVRRGRVHLLYTSPERLTKDQNLKRLLQEMARAGQLHRFVFDEAHCVVEWGHDFRPDYLEAARYVREEVGREVPITALTATAPVKLRNQLREALGLQNAEVTVLERSHDRPEIRYYTFAYRGSDAPIQKLAKLTQILEWIDGQEPGGSVIVYVATRRMAERLAWALRRLGFVSEAYHAGLSDVIRAEVQGRFEEGETPIVVATNAFGMGIDKSNVRAVIHFDPPQSLEAYLQESGRAGRDRRPAYAVLLHASNDWGLIRWLAKRLGHDESHLDELLEYLREEGPYWGYHRDLKKRLDDAVGEGGPSLDSLDRLLSHAARYDLVRYEYKPGRIGIVVEDPEALDGFLGPEAAQELRKAKVGSVHQGAVVLDMARISPKKAESLADSLYHAWREGVVRSFVYWEPALYVERGSGGEKGRAEWREARQSMQEHAEARVEAMRNYATTNLCKREFLLQYLGEAASTCAGCGVCARNREPWALGRSLDLEAIAHAYRPDEVILRFFQEVSERGQHGLGLRKTINALRGVPWLFVAGEAEELPRWIQHNTQFGRLAFVREREIKSAIETLCKKGYLKKEAFKSGYTYAITDAGREALAKMTRRHLKRSEVVV